MKILNHTRGRLLGLSLLALIGATDVAGGLAAELRDLRAVRRAGVRNAVDAAAKSGAGAPFALLVIPVDFADNRLPAGWEPAAVLGPRLDGGAAETLRGYFAAASQARCDLRVVLAPLVSLPGARRDYSDVGYNGFSRTRRLARESLLAVRDLGVEFRRLDNDGPDGLAGTADDDGEVDGVLILHAAVGQENDPDNGLIQPLQYFLDSPVVSDGVAASFYAVAAMRSGLGIWAHETAHLLGLEDRYDPTLSAGGGSEIHSRGGLGAFSLMAAGAWGTGGGRGPALPDAYSRWLLGWCDVEDLPANGSAEAALGPATLGRALRVWTHGRPADEFFLLEVRDPGTAAPFDAAVPAGGMVVYHVDETVPEGALATAGGVHLRVQVVEADADDALREGLDEGAASDLFPGTTGATAFTPATIPDSGGYGGPSLVSLTGITRIDGPDGNGVAFTVSADDGPAAEVDLGFQGESPATMLLQVRAVGAAVRGLTATVTAADPPLGSFVGGGTSRFLDLVESAPGIWGPAGAVLWESDPGLPPEAATRFVVEIAADGWNRGPESRVWYWRDNAAALDFTGAWPGAWSVSHPDGETGTTWVRWDDRSPAVGTGRFLLACVDLDHGTGEAWPAVSYDNRAHATLTSAPLGPGVTAVRIVHTWDTESLVAREVMDGAAAVWVGPGDEVLPATPVDGWPARVSPQALSALHGRDAWGGAGDLDNGGRPVFRTDVLPLPASGPGPWRLRLVFASNTRDWDHRGWQVAACTALDGQVPESALPVRWDSAGLAWVWPDVPTGDPVFVVQHHQDGAWTDLLVRGYEPPLPADGRYAIPAAEVLAALPGPARARAMLRIVGPAAEGLLASGPIVVFPDGGDGEHVAFGRPWPNPALAEVRFLVTVPAGPAASVHIYDLRGRRVRTLTFPPGEHIGVWDGRTGAGARAAAGTYILRLEGSNGILQHKVVLLH